MLRSFFPEMRDDEVLLLVQYDSRPQLPDRPLTELEKSEGGRGFIPPLHTAAALPGSEGGASYKHDVRMFAQGWLLRVVVLWAGRPRLSLDFRMVCLLPQDYTAESAARAARL